MIKIEKMRKIDKFAPNFVDELQSIESQMHVSICCLKTNSMKKICYNLNLKVEFFFCSDVDNINFMFKTKLRKISLNCFVVNNKLCARRVIE